MTKVRKLNLSYRIANYILLFFILVLLIYSFDYSFGYYFKKFFPDIYFFTFGPEIGGLDPKIWQENGLIENLQAILLIIAIINLVVLLINRNKFGNKIIYNLVILNFLGLVYYLGEEISWGQHFLKFSSNNFFLQFNKQSETNIHNISNLFNELPRAIVFIWCSLIIFFYKKINLNKDLKIFICPNESIKKISLLILLISLPYLLDSNFNISSFNGLLIKEKTQYDYGELLKIIFTLKFIRFSELQELLFSYYFFWHAIFLRIKINQIYIK